MRLSVLPKTPERCRDEPPQASFRKAEIRERWKIGKREAANRKSAGRGSALHPLRVTIANKRLHRNHRDQIAGTTYAGASRNQYQKVPVPPVQIGYFAS